jgi:uncharacterized membrane protein (DUF4010 family)
MVETSEALKRLAVALLVGMLIGLDRERAEQRKQRKVFAGVRTFPLIALLGSALALLPPDVRAWLLVAGLLAVAAIALMSYRRGVAEGEIGATTEVAALATYALGVLAGLGSIVVAGAAGVTVAVLLAAKPPLERLSRAISEHEVAAVLELAVISAIVLPLLPDRGFGPWQVLNPFQIWTVVVMVSVVSFAGFVAVRWRGDKAGLYWAAALGALVSSTATTVAMAQRSREAPDQARPVAAATVMASTVMCLRIMILVAAVAPALLRPLLPSIGVMAFTGAALALLLARSAAGRRDPNTAAPSLKNPFSSRAALVFGALFAGTLLLVRASQEWLGAKGTLLAAALSGLVDVDAISIALARTSDGGAAAGPALAGIVIACASNNLFKAGVAVVAGAGRFRVLVAVALAAMSLAGGAGAAVTAGALGGWAD